MSESINEGYIDLKGNGIRYIDKKLNENLKRSVLSKGNVVVTKTGVYFGKSAVIPDEISQANTSAHVAKIVVKEDLLNPYYLSTFLNSTYGHSQLRRRGIKVSRPEIKLVELQDILIPIPKLEFQKKIENIVLLAQRLLKESDDLYNASEKIILDSINYKDTLIDNNPVNIHSLQSSFIKSGRLDSEFYQNKYDQYEELIKNHSDGFTLIEKEFDLYKDSSNKLYEEYNYIEIGDINVSDGSASYNKLASQDLPANAKFEVGYGCLLISKVRPNRGAVAIIDFEVDNLIASGAFTILSEKKESNFSVEVLKILLRTKLYRDWLLKFNVGAQYPVIKDEDILNLPIPNLNPIIQEDIKRKARLSQEVKKTAKSLLRAVKQSVEILIESGEDEATKYLKEILNQI